MKNTTIFFLLMCAFTSCQMKQTDKQASTQSNENALDSAYYFILETGYHNRDTFLLNHFFEQWYQASQRMEMPNNFPLVQALKDIYEKSYHPFDYSKYGWDLFCRYSGYKYAVIPTEIKYEIVHPSCEDSDDELKTERLIGFYPDPDLVGAKRLLDIQPFKKSMELFLEENSSEKLRFLSSCGYISRPMSLNKKKYDTTPEVISVRINKELNHANACIRLISTGLGIELELEDDKWVMKDCWTLWIE